ncbi:hypothetical protein ACH5RR_010697 [Cinchona calisaya]|uniref:Dienelactone hydrolase domain-containing protein n=1 Tax=Cinchona calisaya TaxID=153742 RepID=A0ABD3AJN5_9GENT
MSGPQCCENPPTLSSASGAGSIVQLGGLKSYVSGPSDAKHSLLLLSDTIGYEAPKLRKLADKIAIAGFYVVVPDFFDGDYFDPANSEKPVSVWMKLHGQEKGIEDAKPVIADLKNKGITAVGAAGFCWGAKVAVQLAISGHAQAAVLLHPYSVTVDDIKEINKPIAILGAETDHSSPPELLKQFEEILKSKPEVDSFVKIFPGVSHGWTVRYDEADEKVAKSAEEAHQDMLGWFVKYVK